MVIVNCAPTLSMPRWTVLANRDGLGPAEGLSIRFRSVWDKSIARMAGGAAVDRGVASLPGDMRRDNHAAEVGDEIGAVVSLVRAERQLPREPGECAWTMSSAALLRRRRPPGKIGLHDEPAAVFHQRMTHEAQHRARPGDLVEPGVRVRDRGVGRVRTLSPRRSTRHCGLRGMGAAWAGSGLVSAGRMVSVGARRRASGVLVVGRRELSLAGSSSLRPKL